MEQFAQMVMHEVVGSSDWPAAPALSVSGLVYPHSTDSRNQKVLCFTPDYNLNTFTLVKFLCVIDSHAFCYYLPF